MKTVTLFLALSLSIVSFGCGTENDGTSSSDDGGMTGKMDDPFADLAKEEMYPHAPEGKLVATSTACKTNVYFYESKDGKIINWFGFWNKNDADVNVYVYETSIVSSAAVVTMQPNRKMGYSGERYYQISRGHTFTIYTEKMNSAQTKLFPCETARTTVP